jgi:hypothetical protein
MEILFVGIHIPGWHQWAKPRSPHSIFVVTLESRDLSSHQGLSSTNNATIFILGMSGNINYLFVAREEYASTPNHLGQGNRIRPMQATAEREVYFDGQTAY